MQRARSALGALFLLGGCGLSSVGTDLGTPEIAPTAAGGGTTGSSSGAAPAGGTVPAGEAAVVTLSGSMFTPHIGQKLGAALVDPNQAVLAVADTMVDAGGNFTLAFADRPVAGDGYTIAYYADLNGNGFCNAPPTDHSWTVKVPTVAAATTVAVMHGGNFTPVCESFGTHSLTFDGKDFTGHQQQTFYISVVDTKDNSLVGQVLHGIIPASGVVTFAWPTLLAPDHTYVVSYFADVNSNKMCDSSDHAWMNPISAASNDVTISGDHNAPQQQVCQNFPTGALQ